MTPGRSLSSEDGCRASARRTSTGTHWCRRRSSARTTGGRTPVQRASQRTSTWVMSATSPEPSRCSGAGSATGRSTADSSSVTCPGRPTLRTLSGSTRRERRSRESPSTASFPMTSGARVRFGWPPPKENYVWAALGSAFVEAELLIRSGYRRRVRRGRTRRSCARSLAAQRGSVPRAGRRRLGPVDSELRVWIDFATTSRADGKSMAWTNWTHARRR